MPVSYTNRKGITFFLFQGETKTGKVRYYFTREPKGEEIEQIPSEYEISESVNGVVSLVKVRPRLIPSDEVVLIETTLKRHPNGSNYQVDVKHDRIIIYEGYGPDVEGILALFGKNLPRPAGAIEKLKVEMERYTRFAPVMRFILIDPEKTDLCRRTVVLFRLDRRLDQRGRTGKAGTSGAPACSYPGYGCVL